MGRYSFWIHSSFSRIANTRGTTRFAMILPMAIMMVLVRTCLMSLIWNMYSKFAKPMNGDFHMPRPGLKSSNAITMPNIGTMLKSTSQIIAGISIM